MNNCPKCGNALQPGQDFCTNCGNQVNNANQQPMNMNQPMNNDMNNQMNMNQPMNNDMNNQMNMGQPMNNEMNQPMNMGQPMNNGMNQQMNMNQPMNNGMNQQMNMNQPMNNGQPAKKKNNTVAIILIAVLVLVAAGAIGFMFLNKGDEGNKSNNNDNVDDSGSAETVSDTKGSTVTYSGFTFSVPNGFQSEVIPEDGSLAIYSNDLVIGLKVDYYHTSEEYRTQIAQEYNVDAASLSRKVNGHDYLLLPVKDATTGRIVTALIYDAQGGTIIINLINSRYELPSDAELNTMDQIVSTAKTTSTFAKPNESEKQDIQKFEYKDLFEEVK